MDDDPGMAGYSDGETLSVLLHAWRERLDPSLGMSQKEVARRAGVSDRWYRELVRGRVANFSSEFLDRLALALQLSPGERLVLYLHATGRSPELPAEMAPVEPVEVDSNLQRLLDSQFPHPAFVLDRAWNIVGRNDPLLEWFPWVAHEENLARWMFLYPDAREQLANWWDDWARPLLSQIRIALARDPECRILWRILQEILDNGDARAIWETREVMELADGAVRRLRLDHHRCQEVAIQTSEMMLTCRPGARFLVLMHEPVA
ncbi:helix-turn-helix domain-containing protein [Streptomyces gibsoniae]|uniref:Helix-turn-helix domain-containing protein n=1 Tax=Streptomyces gibsoniae TaxID=3075529 RepID=A0ABU2TVE3_9ACTN|nr:helix-turn-helix domain-containing protein [Streptomyces sp. DSM 41699]MDT0464791.1 helix-turn-helix domain-containing protein [Streptomyces sp. DSM 41699]